MDHEIIATGSFRGIAKSGEVMLMAVHAAVRDKAKKVEPVPPCFGKSLLQHGILLKGALADGFVNASKILIDDAARAEIEVPDFAIPHLSRRQADVLATGANGATRVGGV